LACRGLAGGVVWRCGGACAGYTTLATVANVQPDPAAGPALTRDPDDDCVIHLARAHDADYIVSGDADLLEWNEQDPPVVPPAEFEARLSQS